MTMMYSFIIGTLSGIAGSLIATGIVRLFDKLIHKKDRPAKD